MPPDVSPSESAGQRGVFPRSQLERVTAGGQQALERVQRATPSAEVIAGGQRTIEAIPDMDSLHALVAVNPFSEENSRRIKHLAIIREGTAESLAAEPSATAQFDVITEILLNEPTGDYDRDFDSLHTTGDSPKEGQPRRPELRENRIEQRKRLEREMDTSAYMTADVALDVKGDMKWFMDNIDRPQDIYQRLSNVAFQTDNYDTIQKQFSREQRLGYRLAIVNFIRDLQGIQSLQKQIQDKPPVEQVQDIIGHPMPITDATIDVNPMGFVIELSSEDYRAALGQEHLGEYLDGLFTYQPPRSWYSVIFINKDRIAEAPQTKNQTQREYILDHELRHAFFNKFARRKLLFPTYESQAERQREVALRGLEPNAISSRYTVDDALSAIDSTSDVSLDLLVNETLAYASGDSFREFEAEHRLSGDTMTPLLVSFLNNLREANASPSGKRTIWEIATRIYARHFRLFRASGMVFPQLLLNGNLPDVPGRQLTGKVDKIAFFSGLLANDTEKDTWLNLHKYTRRYLHESLSSVIAKRTGKRDRASQRESVHLQRFEDRDEWLMEQQMRFFQRFGPNATIREFSRFPTGFSPDLLPGAITWLQSDRSQRFPAITQALIPCLNEILFAYPDTANIDQLRNLDGVLERLPLSPEDTRMRSYVDDIRKKISDALKVRTARF